MRKTSRQRHAAARTRLPACCPRRAWPGKKEGEGPLKRCFDYISPDAWFGEKSWEKAESTMLRKCFSIACDKAALAPSGSTSSCPETCSSVRRLSLRAARLRRALSGPLRACSTMSEALCLGSVLIDGGSGQKVAALTSSHFCSAERQFRYPLEYGSIRTPTSQWTATAAGAVILCDSAPARI